MQLQSKSLLRMALVAAVLTVAAPAFAADEINVTARTPVIAGASETVDKALTIGAAAVRVKLVGPTAYLAVGKGTVDVTYADGAPMMTIPEGTALQVTGFILPGSSVVASLSSGKAILSLGAAAAFKLQSNTKGSELKIMQGGSTTPVVLAPGKATMVAAPMTSFGANQAVTLKENEIGRASAGSNSILVVGTANGLAVTTNNATATIKGGGNDELILAKGAVLSINNGSLYVSATAISLSGAQLQLVSTAGSIQVVHDGKSMPFATGQTIGGPAPAANTAAATEEGDTDVEAVEVTEEEAEVLYELDEWNKGN